MQGQPEVAQDTQKLLDHPLTHILRLPEPSDEIAAAIEREFHKSATAHYAARAFVLKNCHPTERHSWSFVAHFADVRQFENWKMHMESAGAWYKQRLK